MATGAPPPLLQRTYDRRAEDAVLSLVSTLPPNSGALLLQRLDQGMGERDLLWCSLCHGEEAAPSSSQASSCERRGITPEDGDGDPAFPHSQQRMHLQRIISGHVDDGLRATLLQKS